MGLRLRRSLLFEEEDSETYTDKVLGIETANMIAYWPMNEASGGVADNAEGTAARDGAYTGVTLGQTGIGDGETCPLFDGTNDYNNVYTTSFRDAFNGGEFTGAAWAKVSAAGVWTDSAEHMIFQYRVDNTNKVSIYKPTANNNLSFYYRAGGTIESHIKTDASSTGWMHLAITVSKTAGVDGEVKYYYNGSAIGSTSTGLGTWAGALASTVTVIGASNLTPVSPWDGWLAHAAVWTKPLTSTQILSLATV